MPSDSQVLSRLVKRMHKRESDPLRPLLDQYYMKRGRSSNRLSEVRLPLEQRARPGGRLSPSSLGGCKREAVLNFTGTKGSKRLDPDSEAIFEDGNWRHFKWGALFQDMEQVLGRDVFRVVAIERPVIFEELRIAGSYDVLIAIYGVLYLVDFKGINDAGFTRIVTDDAPLSKHVSQLVAYLKARRIRRGLLLYENKNNQLTRCFIVKKSDAAWLEVQDWSQSVLDYLESRRLPSKDIGCVAGNFVYERCRYAKLCFGSLDHEDIREIAYEGFPGVEEAWIEGHRRAGTMEFVQ